MELIVDNSLTEESLRLITGFDDLTAISALTLVVADDDSCESGIQKWSIQSFSIVPTLIPHLQRLTISGSSIPRMKDLGAFHKFDRLRILYANNCKTSSLEGIHFAHQLAELYAAFNRIESLLPLNALYNLEIVDVEGNALRSWEDVECGLKNCSDLVSLTVSGNPIGQHRPPASLMEFCPQLGIITELGDDPDITKELGLVLESVKANRDVGVEKLIEVQHRHLSSRAASSSCAHRGAHVVEEIEERHSASAPGISECSHQSTLSSAEYGLPNAIYCGNVTRTLRKQKETASLMKASDESRATSSSSRPVGNYVHFDEVGNHSSEDESAVIVHDHEHPLLRNVIAMAAPPQSNAELLQEVTQWKRSTQEILEAEIMLGNVPSDSVDWQNCDIDSTL